MDEDTGSAPSADPAGTGSGTRAPSSAPDDGTTRAARTPDRDGDPAPDRNGSATPDPATPDPAAPDPVRSVAATPDSATPDPAAAAPATPDVPAEPARGRSARGVPGSLRTASEVCARLLVLAIGLATLIYLVVLLRVVVIPVAIAILLAALLAPVVRWLTRHRVPRWLATVLVLIGGLALIAGLLTFVINTLISGFAGLASQLSDSVGSIQDLLDRSPFDLQLASVQNLPAQIESTLRENQQALTTGALSTAATVTEVLAGFALTLFSLIFLLYDGPRIWRFAQRLAPRSRRARVDIAGRRAFASLVGYTRATVLVAIVDAVGIGIGMWAVGVPLAFPLAALVFLGAFVPTVGAVVTGVIAVLIALVANGLVPALIVLAVVIGVQQLEGHVLQPLLLGRAVQLHPLAVTLSVAAGVVVAGIAGALLAVPLLAVLSAAVRSFAAPREQDVAEVDALNATHGHPPATVSASG